MKRIGVISDTHGQIHPGVVKFLQPCGEIWHAGDIGPTGFISQLPAKALFRAVYGNIDDAPTRLQYAEHLSFACESRRVLMLHIAGYPGRYNARARELISLHRPHIVVAGHSHILKVVFDPANQHLHLNPGAAGTFGFHQSVTALRFVVDGEQLRDMEVLDIARQK